MKSITKSDGVLSIDDAVLTPTALTLPEKLTEQQWEKIGAELGRIDSAQQWWIGDWWAFGEHKYGERKETVEAENWTGPAFGTCANAARVCAVFKTSHRREVLSFRHHTEVASIKDEALRESLLDWCEAPVANGKKKPRSIRELQQEILSRHNNFLFEAICKDLDELVRGWQDRPADKLKEAKGAIVLALTKLVKLSNKEKTLLNVIEMQTLVSEIAAEMLGSVHGDVKMLVEFIGPLRQLVTRKGFDYDEMVKAVPAKLIKDDLATCKKAISMIETFVGKLEQKL
jgi:hypothetical protein